jgi:cysteine desulfurase
VARLVGARAAQVIFTGSGSEANNLALAGAARPVLVGATEHASVLQATRDPAIIAVDSEGRLNLGALEESLVRLARPAIVAVMLANNETGVINDIALAATLAHRHGALVHCDAVQAVGKIPVDFAAPGVDMLSLSAHKLGGPQGVGALVVREGVDLAPLIKGGGQEFGRRAGTEPVAAIHGFGVAAEMAGVRDWSHVARLRDGLERRLPAAWVWGRAAARLPNTSCLEMPGVAAETQVMNFDLAGIAISAGSACSSGKVRASHVLDAMNVPSDRARCAVRVSLGLETTAAEVDRFVETWTAMWARLGASRAAAPAA